MSRPTPAYLEMIKSRLDAMNASNGNKSGKTKIDNNGMVDYYAEFRNDDHFDMMGRAALDYMQKQRDQNGGHPRI